MAIDAWAAPWRLFQGCNGRVPGSPMVRRKTSPAIECRVETSQSWGNNLTAPVQQEGIYLWYFHNPYIIQLLVHVGRRPVLQRSMVEDRRRTTRPLQLVASSQKVNPSLPGAQSPRRRI